MNIDPKGSLLNYLAYAFIGGRIFILILLATVPIHLVIMSFFYTPLWFLVVFFIALSIVHLLLCQLIFKTPLKEIGVILLYTIVVDAAIFLLQGHITTTLLYPPILVSFLIAMNASLQYLINYHIQRNLFAKFPNGNFTHELKTISIEIKLRDEYNLIILLALYIAGFSGFYLKWDAYILMKRFAEYSFLCIAVLSIIRILIDSNKMATIFYDEFLPSIMGIPNYGNTDYYLFYRAIEERMSRASLTEKEEIVDYFDRAAEIRKIIYYSSLSLLLVASAYLALYTLLPNRLINISLRKVVLASCIIGLLAIQLPYYIGQKRLALNLTASFSGTEHREMTRLLGKESPAWHFIQIGEILGAGLVPAVLIWLIQTLANAID